MFDPVFQRVMLASQVLAHTKVPRPQLNNEEYMAGINLCVHIDETGIRIIRKCSDSIGYVCVAACINLAYNICTPHCNVIADWLCWEPLWLYELPYRRGTLISMKSCSLQKLLCPSHKEETHRYQMGSRWILQLKLPYIKDSYYCSVLLPGKMSHVSGQPTGCYYIPWETIPSIRQFPLIFNLYFPLLNFIPSFIVITPWKS